MIRPLLGTAQPAVPSFTALLFVLTVKSAENHVEPNLDFSTVGKKAWSSVSMFLCVGIVNEISYYLHFVMFRFRVATSVLPKY